VKKALRILQRKSSYLRLFQVYICMVGKGVTGESGFTCLSRPGDRNHGVFPGSCNKLFLDSSSNHLYKYKLPVNICPLCRQLHVYSTEWSSKFMPQSVLTYIRKYSDNFIHQVTGADNAFLSNPPTIATPQFLVCTMCGGLAVYVSVENA